MIRSQSLSVPAPMQSRSPMKLRAPKRVTRLFGDLKVRMKLMVLHNVFFLILAIGVYFALYPYLPDHAKTNAVHCARRHLHPGRAGARNHHHAAVRLSPAAADAGGRSSHPARRSRTRADRRSLHPRRRNRPHHALAQRHRHRAAQARRGSGGSAAQARSAGPAGEPGPAERQRGARAQHAAHGAARLHRKAHRNHRRRRYAGTAGPHAARYPAHPPHQRKPGGFLARPQAAHGAGAAAPFDRRSLDAGGHRQ